MGQREENKFIKKKGEVEVKEKKGSLKEEWMADSDQADISKLQRSHQRITVKVTEEEAQAAGGFKERRMCVCV